MSVEELYLLNKSEKFITINLHIRKINVDLAKRAALCMSSNEESRTEIHCSYEVSTKLTAHLCDIVNQTTQLKSDVRVLIITRSDCERVNKSKLYKEVI